MGTVPYSFIRTLVSIDPNKFIICFVYSRNLSLQLYKEVNEVQEEISKKRYDIIAARWLQIFVGFSNFAYHFSWCVFGYARPVRGGHGRL